MSVSLIAIFVTFSTPETVTSSMSFNGHGSSTLRTWVRVLFLYEFVTAKGAATGYGCFRTTMPDPYTLFDPKIEFIDTRVVAALVTPWIISGTIAQ
jgi:hypothetical protein